MTSLCGLRMQTVKMGVQYSLWGGSILNLGTERHRKAYFDDIDKFRLPGDLAFPAQSTGLTYCLESQLRLCAHFTDQLWLRSCDSASSLDSLA